jgi:hypothetical protein
MIALHDYDWFVHRLREKPEQLYNLNVSDWRGFGRCPFAPFSE